MTEGFGLRLGSDEPGPGGVKLTAAILVTITLQGIGGLLWIGAAAQRLDAIEHRIEASSPVAERLARVEAEMVALRTTLARIETRLDQREVR